MTPTFKLIAKSHRDHFFVTQEWLSNGHWMVTRDTALKSPHAPTPLKKMALMREGRYEGSLTTQPIVHREMPNFAHVIPRREGYRLLDTTGPYRAQFKGNEVTAYVYETEHKTDREPVRIGIKPTYVPLLALGYAFARDANSPIIVLSEPTLNAPDLRAVIMPVRI